MNIDYVIVSSDNNKLYLDFWPIVRDMWYDLVKIKPILVLISDRDFITENEKFIIHELKSINDIDTGFQSQISRMYITKFYKNSICLTSDIDMIPLNRNYFINSVVDVDDNSIVILSSDAYNSNRYPLCYNVASGNTFNEILDLECSFEDYCKRLLEYKQGWDTDELYFSKCVNEFSYKDRIVFKKRGWINGIAKSRIDRCNWRYDINLLKNNYYIDSHSLRPYFTYKKQIDQLINYIRN